MSHRVNPNLHKEITAFGKVDVTACMNCGNCTATCKLADANAIMPRRIIHYLQMGLEDKMMQSADPWLCYYCGDCSVDCPREADPGEIMMVARRYLIAKYDWTGLGRLLYKSLAWEIGALAFVSLVVIALFAFLHGPVVTEYVVLNTFAPAEWVEFGDLTMAGVLLFFLLSNSWRMYRNIMKGVKAPLYLYATQAFEFVLHFFTQKRWRNCGDEGSKKNTRWLVHVILVSGYVTMMVLVIGLLRWYQTDEPHPLWHPMTILGFYASAALLYGTVNMMIGRARKVEEIHKFSEPSDWIFLILLFLTALTGLLMHLVHLADLPLTTYIMYVIHLAIAVPMLVVEVPFGKWSHMFYRPLAMYLTKVKEKAAALPVREEGGEAAA